MWWLDCSEHVSLHKAKTNVWYLHPRLLKYNNWYRVNWVDTYFRKRFIYEQFENIWKLVKRHPMNIYIFKTYFKPLQIHINVGLLQCSFSTNGNMKYTNIVLHLCQVSTVCFREKNVSFFHINLLRQCYRPQTQKHLYLSGMNWSKSDSQNEPLALLAYQNSLVVQCNLTYLS